MSFFDHRMILCALLGVALLVYAEPIRAAADTYEVGVARVDITPQYPIRLNGFGYRREECEGITQPIFAKALAIGSKDEEAIILFTIDATGIREAMIDKVAGALRRAKGIRRENVIATFTHTHTAPKLADVCDTIFSSPIPPEHQRHIDQYTAELTAALEKVALEALVNRKPSRLQWGVGRVGFAVNRRTKGGPVDHTLPVLVVRSADDNTIRAIYATYACHCVTLSNNKISGDWAGFAQHAIETTYPGAVAMISIGCGSDSNPDSGVVVDKTAVAADQGSQIADEVRVVLEGKLTPIAGAVSASLKHIDLPLNELPSRDELVKLAGQETPAGYNAKFQLAKLDKGQQLINNLDYPIQLLTFGDSLAMVFLGGEVCVDYANRLREELDPARVWLHGYSNDFCVYIPSERLLKEGGYGGGAEVVYFALPATLAPGLEDKIVAAVHEQIPRQFEGKGPRRQVLKHPWPLKAAIASIQVPEGYVVEAVAAEPLVADPVAIDLALDGSIWVADMTDYTKFVEDEFPQTGSVRRLRDLDGDGKYDKVEMFEEGLRFPTDVKAWGKGVIVCDAPDVIYLEDSDGDGKADVRKVLLTGFATHNAQARVNSIRWGLDNWLYGSCGLFGGTISTFTGQKLDLGERDFRFHPDTGEIEPVTGKTQQGRARDDWGNWFGCENGALISHYPLTDIYLKRNPHFTPPATEVYVPAGRDPNRLFPIGEPTLYKLSGAPGRPTSACGLDFYRDELLGDTFSNNAFVAEPVNHLVRRLVLTPHGATFEGHRAPGEMEREFLASEDPWFRPVQVRTGLDGCLYVVDMYRAVIEHPKFIPEETLRDLDLMAGRNEGRIYRIRRQDRAPRPPVKVDPSNADDLVAALDTPNGPQRDLVQETLVQMQATEIARQLEAMVRSAALPAVRMQALCTLDGLKMLTPALVEHALADADASVRRHAIRLSEQFADDTPVVVQALLRLVDDRDPQVQLQLACSLGAFSDKNCPRALARLAWDHHDDPFVIAGVWSSINQANVGEVGQAIFELSGGNEVPDNLLDSCMALTAALGTPDDLHRLAAALSTSSPDEQSKWQFEAATKLMKAASSRNTETKERIVQDLAPLVEGAASLHASESVDDDLWLAALHVQVAANPVEGELIASLEDLLTPQHSPTVQQAAVEIICSLNSDEADQLLSERWDEFTPAIRGFVFDSLVARPAWVIAILSRIDAKELLPADLDALQRQRLLTHPDQGVRERAAKSLQFSTNADRQKIVEQYLAESHAGDAVRGRTRFKATCSSCHKLDGEGYEVGPDLTALTTRTREALFESILDPNRAIDERYRSYTVLTTDGMTRTGLLIAETSTSITLAEQQGKTSTILRSEIEMLKQSGKSLMPEGLENDLTPQDVTDIVAYITNAGQAPKKIDGNQPRTVVADKDGIYRLTADCSEIYGTEVTFETANRNIGYWHDESDHVDWTLSADDSNQYDVYLHWALTAESAGNRLVIDGASAPVHTVLESTGGYDNYQLKKIGNVTVSEGECRIVAHSDGPLVKRNLMDLRGIYLVPAGRPFSDSDLDLKPQ